MPIKITPEILDELEATGISGAYDSVTYQCGIEEELLALAREALALRQKLREIDDWLWTAPTWPEKPRTYQEAMDEAK